MVFSVVVNCGDTQTLIQDVKVDICSNANMLIKSGLKAMPMQGRGRGTPDLK